MPNPPKAPGSSPSPPHPFMPDVKQRVAVSEGLALGLVLLGSWSIPFDAAMVHRAVVGAYLDWPRAHDFPRVEAELRSGLSGVHALTRADDAMRTFALYWGVGAREGALRIRSWYDDWTPTRAEDVDFAVEVIAGRITRAEWAGLAGGVLERLG